MIDDIPEATRERLNIPQRPSKKGANRFLMLISLLILGAIAFVFVSLIRPQLSNNSEQIIVNDQKSQQNKIEKVESSVAETPPIESEDEPKTTYSKSLPKPPEKDDLLGHLPYQDANSADLVAITNDGRIKLHQAAATKFLRMQADAKAAGINLVILSGFRDQELQNHLFFAVKEQRVQATEKRAEVSAPPGYSEHHTGYALDFGDGQKPATNLEVEFEQTSAFRWLQKNAAKYSFELSFPRDNPQGISYEPWHWRFVGDRTSLETFYKARNF